MRPSHTAEPGSKHPTALAIAGFDPGSGAGVTADLLVFARHRVFATAAITALTVQSTRGVRRVQPVAADLLRETLDELEADLPADGVKLGMLGEAAQVAVVADFLAEVRRRRPVTVVLDPVIASSSGAALLDAAGLAVLRDRLLPLVDAMTPNLHEASLLTGLPCRDAPEAEGCAAALVALYPQAQVVVTGGHLQPPRDLLWTAQGPLWIPGERIDSRATHGTGCAFSSALLAARLHGGSWPEAAESAKAFVGEAMRTAAPRGAGHGPMRLF